MLVDKAREETVPFLLEENPLFLKVVQMVEMVETEEM